MIRVCPDNNNAQMLQVWKYFTYMAEPFFGFLCREMFHTWSIGGDISMSNDIWLMNDQHVLREFQDPEMEVLYN